MIPFRSNFVDRRQAKVWLKRIVFLLIQLLFYAKKTISIPFTPVKKVRSILLVETAFLGDVIAITPLIEVLAKKMPNAIIDVIVERKNIPILQFESKINTLYGMNTSLYSSFFNSIIKLRKQAYDLVICTSPGVKNSMIALLTGKSFITGYLVHPIRDTSFYNDFYAVMTGNNDKSFYPKTAHLTQRALTAVAPLGFNDMDFDNLRVRLRLSPKIDHQTKTALKKKNFIEPGKINLVIHPCASWVFKQWPLDSFVSLIKKLFEKYNGKIHIILIGLPSEKSDLDFIKKNVPYKIMLLCGANLTTVMGLIKCADIFLGNDSGPKHIADAFSKPVVELLGPSTPETVGGRNPKVHSCYANIRCSPCSHLECFNEGRCMKAITVESVLPYLYSLIDKQLIMQRNVTY
ncbi:MAG: glycosyltransferase family 9 protein [Desulfobacteraceae bacterium]